MTIIFLFAFRCWLGVAVLSVAFMVTPNEDTEITVAKIARKRTTMIEHLLIFMHVAHETQSFPTAECQIQQLGEQGQAEKEHWYHCINDGHEPE